MPARCASRLGLVDGLGAIHLEHDLVGEPVAEEVHRQRDDERDQHSALAADRPAGEHEHGREHGEQQSCLEDIGHDDPPFRRVWRATTAKKA
jgi:hypothetical protein